MHEPNQNHARHLLHFLFSELPLIPLDRRCPHFMAGLRFAVGVIVAFLTIVFLVGGLWWGAVLAAPVAGLIWTGYVDLSLARDSGRATSLLTSL
jgi:uncharacterized membrane protein